MLGGFVVGVSDYYFPSAVGEKDEYLKFCNRETGHWGEAYATWTGDKIPLWVTVSTYVYGADKNESVSRCIPLMRRLAIGIFLLIAIRFP